jgi:hypothetical protein
MTKKPWMIDAQGLIEWLQVMAEEMEVVRGDVYFAGAAKSYRTTIAVLQSNIFDLHSDEETER